ncbi:MAG: hypothetical protein AAGB18_09145 [Pseudomonadota bacterium]
MAVLAGLVGLGLLFSGPLAALECLAPWLSPLLSLMVTAPAVYSAVFLLEAVLQAKTDGDSPEAQLYQAYASALTEAAGKLPRLAIVPLCLGLAGQVVLTSGNLLAQAPCVAG